MTERLRLGIIGLGAMGAELLSAGQDHPDVVITRAADPSAAAVESARAVDPSVALGQDPAQVIKDDTLDAVYVASPPATHAAYVVDAMRAGRHVFCEKPLAVSQTDADAMLAAERDSGLVGAVNFSLSDRAAVLEVERALLAGEVGDVLGVQIDLRFPEWPRAFQQDARWVAGRAEGGFLREVFSHFAYLTQRLLGPITIEEATTSYPADGGETSAFARLSAQQADRSVPITLSGLVGSSAPETYDWTLLGEQRSYRLSDWSRLEASERTEPGWRPVELAGENGSERTRLSAFAAATRGERSPSLASFADAYGVQQLVEALHSDV
ncbi:Gfo/Idh/MocA family protein [Luteipulveratus mongoliensis]|uniref:Oxidoreductase n=1 Tax=Luteipulveratus mongoliensis TaxID=571913 RepID=A0A0K1JLZ2_9MICO|nr:Gfo/Idh/MocA family oxidoreductase [Luteipulveratus mongoliensis]AKU17727.1 oxidoreductase [Luteipulveratus mongoliensis]